FGHGSDGAFMEPSGCNRWQPVANAQPPGAAKASKTFAVGCDGKEGDDGSSPSEGFAIPPAQPSSLFSVVTPAVVFGVHASSTSVHDALRASRSLIACSRPSRARWP